MKKILVALILLITVLNSCTKDKIKVDPNNLLIGIWNYSDYMDNATVFSRSQKFNDNHCYQFNSDGTLSERKINGWCGTPPVTYADYSGEWTILNDTLIQVNVGYWGGTMSYKLDIQSVTKDSLKVLTISDNN